MKLPYIPIISLFIVISFFSSIKSYPGNVFDLDQFQDRSIEPPANYSTPWVDSVLYSLTLEQKIAQLLMIEVSSNQNRSYYNRIERLIRNYNIGGIVFFKGGPASQLNLTNHWQRVAQTPMLIAMDAEWGLSMRLDSTLTFPRQITLGALHDDRLLYELGLEMGRQCRRMGVNMSFSPVIDVNSNPDNPVINSRSFGECRYNVTRKGMAMMFGLQDAGIIATAKHFPGHGDTDVDSHHALPLIQHPYPKLDSIHLFPFRHLIDKGLMGVMVAHLNIPSLEQADETPSSLSKNIVTGLLQEEMGFNGLIVTDALNMKGVTGKYRSGKVELMAFKAGNDILLMPEDVPQAINAIKRAIEDNLIDEEYLNQKCRKVLYLKEQAGLSQLRTLTLNNLHSDLNSQRAQDLNKRLAEAAITVVKNDNDLLPLQRLDTLRIATLSIGSSVDNPFQAMLANYAPVSMFSMPKNHNSHEAMQMMAQLENYNLVVVSIQNNSMFPGRNYGINQATIGFVNQLAANKKVILNVFANPYSLSSFGDELMNNQSIVVSYQDGRDFEEASAQVIFGALPARGRLPVSVLPYFSIYTGINTPGRLRIKYSESELSGININMLARIDSIIHNAIEQRAFPGCQVAVVKDGTMIYNRSFGYHTYDSTSIVRNSDIYDLASLTKVIATTSAIMHLVDQGLIDIDKPISHYLPSLNDSNKQKLKIREVLAHQARFRSWIPFFLNTLEEGRPSESIYSTVQTADYPTAVANGLYINKVYRDSIFETIRSSDLLTRKRYIYSDLGFILFAEMIEQVTGEPFDEYIEKTFFRPLGLQTMGFTPLRRFSADRIVPTELDTVFRQQLVHGFVHDPTAAMLGGVSGHAGLFSNAGDVAVFMQMLLQKGSYGGKDYIHPSTVKEFSTTQYAGNQNRRGLGFDKPAIKPDNGNPACESASMLSFGHSGFTGTYAWADPQENLVFVFLSNRVFPSSSNRLITELEVRSNLFQVVYDAIYFERFMLNNRLP
ncbi:MAG: glycoside hydrolase family 3 N-terminal domain-containing protein [Bacteroidota bacterium]